MGTKRMGSVGAERESPALAVTAEQGQLCSLRTLELCSAPLGARVAELMAQPGAQCCCPSKGCVPQPGQLRAELCPVPDPKLSPSQGFAASWGVASGEFPSPCIACWKSPPLPPGLVPSLVPGALPPVCSRASFPFRETLHGPCFWPACSISLCWFSSIFFSPLLSLEAEIPRVSMCASCGSWKAALGQVGGGNPGVLLRVRLSVTVCSCRQGEPAGR